MPKSEVVYSDVSDLHGQPAIRIQHSPLARGVTVRATRSMMVTIISPDTESTCEMPAGLYLAVARSARRLHSQLSGSSNQTAYLGRHVMIRRSQDGYLELKMADEGRGVLMVDAQFLAFADNPAYVITAAHKVAEIPLPMPVLPPFHTDPPRFR